ncbi:MAG TPA: hypothetical protein VKB43_10430 [Gaiellaceae bacterium]|nr:hypothetical protein [Gaiellaceae bacterium]
MRRLALCLVAVVGALVIAPLALADGPSYVVQGGAGVATPGGSTHWVTVSDGTRGTLLEKITAGGTVDYWIRFKGAWGTPVLGQGPQAGQGISHDGRTLVLESTPGPPYAAPSKFLVVNLRRMRAVRTIVLHGYFSFDALSPDASRMYVIEYTHSGDVSHYIVRAFDLRTHRLLPGKIVDRTDDEKTMAGYAMTRTTSVGGRWVYTLYQKPSGAGFVHALDTVGGVAHCIDLPPNHGLYNIVLSMRDGGRTLALRWRSGRPWLDVSVGTWQISSPASDGFPWVWVGAGIGGALALLAAGVLLLRRRRGKELEQHPGQELGLA